MSHFLSYFIFEATFFAESSKAIAERGTVHLIYATAWNKISPEKLNKGRVKNKEEVWHSNLNEYLFIR